jgi:hypothetical protein
LIASAIFGGGIEVKEIKVPHIGGSARLASALAGIACNVLALSLHGIRHCPCAGPCAAPYRGLGVRDARLGVDPCVAARDRRTDRQAADQP